MNRLETQNLRQTYDSRVVLNGISYVFNAGESVAISGKSGMGKSTFLQILSGLQKPESGSVIKSDSSESIDLHTCSERTTNKLRRKDFGFVYQQHFLLKDFNVLDNLLVAKSDKKRAIWLLDKLGLGDKIKAKYNELSGGERQRVAIARALMNKPSFLFADEPTGNLDDETTEAVWRLLSEIKEKEEFGIILVTHDLNLANMCDKHIQLKDGVFHTI